MSSTIRCASSTLAPRSHFISFMGEMKLSAIAILRWKAIAILKSTPFIDQPNIIFNSSPYTGLYSQFDLPLSYVPKVLAPTVVYHQVIGNLLKKNGFEVKEKRYPYKLFVQGIGTVSLNLQIKLFPPNILSVTVQVSDFPVEVEPNELIALQRLNRIKPISEIVQWTIGMAETLNQRRFDQSQSFQFKPAVFLDQICSPERFQQLVRSNLPKFTGILIRNPEYELMDDDIPVRIMEKNKGHNLKSSQELMLLDKQGLLYLTPSSNKDRKTLIESFIRVHDLYEIAYVYSTYLDGYLHLRAYSEDFADFILYIIRPWIEESQVIFKSSVSNRHIWDLLMAELGLKSQFEYILRNGEIVNSLTLKSGLFEKFSKRWWATADFVSSLSRKIQESKDFSLEFLGNTTELKMLILADYGEAQRSVQCRNFKAAMIISGSICEALLTAGLDAIKPPLITTKALYEDYNLFKLIQAAKQYGLVTDGTLLLHLDALRQYRNLIHPGVQTRKSLLPDESKARIALETVNLLVKELNKTIPSLTTS